MNEIEGNEYYELEQRLYHDLNLEIEIPDKFKRIIREGPRENKKYSKFAKIVATICATLLIGAGIVYAGVSIYENIWKKPEKIEGFYSGEGENIYPITEEEKSSVISESDAKKRAEQILKQFGCENEKIKSIEIENLAVDYDLLWHIRTDKNTEILIDAKNTDNFRIMLENELSEVEKYEITEKEAEEIAKNICRKLGYNIDEYNDIRIFHNGLLDENIKMWKIVFYKEYNEIVNPYESIRIGFIPKTNKICYFFVSNREFENNPIEIREEQAKEIVLKEEEKITMKYKEIKNIETELGIIETNGNAYLRVTDYKKYREQLYKSYPEEDVALYRTESHIRRAWIVTIEYDVLEDTEESNDINERYYSYFVDATTGEIIGGELYYQNIKKLLYEY